MADPTRHLTLRLPWLLLVCAGLLGLSAAMAVDAPSKLDGPVFAVLAAGGQPLPEGLCFLKSPDEGIPLKTSPARRTEALPGVVGKALVFGIPRLNPVEGESLFETVCSVAWPAGATQRALVLLAVDGKRVGGVAINDGEDVFPPGTLRVINLINRPVTARWGDFTGEFPPGLGSAHPYPRMQATPNGQPSRFKVMLGVPRADGSGVNIIYAGRAEARAGARTLIVVREVKETDVTDEGAIVDAGVSYNTRWVVDSLPKPEAAAASKGL